MGLMDAANRKIATYDFWDISLTKLGAFTFALFLVAIWPALASLAWYWYLAIAVLAGIRPAWKFLK